MKKLLEMQGEDSVEEEVYINGQLVDLSEDDEDADNDQAAQ